MYIHTHIAHVFICISFFYSWQESGTSSQSRNASKQLAMNWRDFFFGTSYRHSESSTMNDVHVTYSLTRRSSTTMLHVIYRCLGEYHYICMKIDLHAYVLLNLRFYAITCVILYAPSCYASPFIFMYYLNPNA